MATKKATTAKVAISALVKPIRVEVTEPRSEYGTPMPTILVRFPADTHFRIVRAAGLRLAAEIELATLGGQSWCVQLGDCERTARVYLELADGTPAETQMAMAMLRAVAQKVEVA